MKTLLVPVDFSQGTDSLLNSAAELARELGAGLLAIHVVEPVSAYVPVGASMDVIAPAPVAADQADEEKFLKRLNTLLAPLRETGLEAEALVTTGLAAEEILEQISLRKPRLVVMASHGHGAIYHLFTGSVVTEVLKHSPVAVVVVPVKKPA